MKPLPGAESLVFYGQRPERKAQPPSWKEVKQVPVLLATLKGPGPCKYLRPSCTGYLKHDCTMFQEPVFTMHGLHTEKRISDVCAPGPCYDLDPKITRRGPASCPKVPMQERVCNPRASPSLGPGRYSPEKVPPPAERRAPQCSFGLRCPYRESDPNPAPNRYRLPGTLGPGAPPFRAAPRHSLAGRVGHWFYKENVAGGPGPAAYPAPEPALSRARGPAHSLARRFAYPVERTRRAGPGAHDAHRVTAHRPRAPAFSMAAKHSPHLCPLLTDVRD